MSTKKTNISSLKDLNANSKVAPLLPGPLIRESESQIGNAEPECNQNYSPNIRF